MRGKTVSRLVEPLVASPAGGSPEDVARAGRSLVSQGHVAISTSEPQRVAALVTDGDNQFHVELSATGDGLLASCTCTSGPSEDLCAHSFATAYITWQHATQTA